MSINQMKIEGAPPIPAVCPKFARGQAQRDVAVALGTEPGVITGSCIKSDVRGPFYTQKVAPEDPLEQHRAVVTRAWMCRNCGEAGKQMSIFAAGEQDFTGWAPGKRPAQPVVSRKDAARAAGRR